MRVSLEFRKQAKVQESFCCHPVDGVGVSTYKFIAHNSSTHIDKPFILGTHMDWNKTFTFTPKLLPLTLTLESAFRFQNLHLWISSY